MSVKAKDIIKCMEKLAPKHLAEAWDNPGIMIGDCEMYVNKILFALDCSESVIDEAIEIGANMIITHHPMIFKGIKSVTANTSIGRKIIKAAKNDIIIYAAHTNLDIAEGGTNSVLADLIGLTDLSPLLEADKGNYIGKTGYLKNTVKFIDFINEFKQKINAEHIVVNGDYNRIIKKIGLCTGKASSADYITAAKNNDCDLYITGDVGYHDAQVAEELDICLIDGTHYLTEVIVVPELCKYIKNNINGVECICSSVNGQTLNIV